MKMQDMKMQDMYITYLYDTIQLYLTCSQKLTSSQLSLPHVAKQKFNKKWKQNNKRLMQGPEAVKSVLWDWVQTETKEEMRCETSMF